MQINLNSDITKWLDDNRSNLSRQSFITILIRSAMSNTSPTKGINEQDNINGVIDAPSQI